MHICIIDNRGGVYRYFIALEQHDKIQDPCWWLISFISIILQLADKQATFAWPAPAGTAIKCSISVYACFL